jgi:hypothetical protein
MLNGVSLAQLRELMLWSDNRQTAVGGLDGTLNSERLGEKGMVTSHGI